MREALERLKNRNHTLRKLLKNQECLLNNAKCKHCSRLLERYDDIDLLKDSEDSRENDKKITNDLVAAIKILQSKCRIKDGMIVALADELTGADKSDRIRRILRRLADDVNPDCQIIDFDRSTLWKYLVSKDRFLLLGYIDFTNGIINPDQSFILNFKIRPNMAISIRGHVCFIFFIFLSLFSYDYYDPVIQACLSSKRSPF